VDVQVNSQYQFTLISAHLKSRREVPEADQAELREQEAIILRDIVAARLNHDPKINLIVLGDFNDLQDSTPVRTIIGRGKNALTDTRPVERKGDSAAELQSQAPARTISWTYYYAKDDTYSRIDYILLSPGMAREWEPDGTYVLTLPDWGGASDHRPIIARFFAEDK